MATNAARKKTNPADKVDSPITILKEATCLWVANYSFINVINRLENSHISPSQTPSTTPPTPSTLGQTG